MTATWKEKQMTKWIEKVHVTWLAALLLTFFLSSMGCGDDISASGITATTSTSSGSGDSSSGHLPTTSGTVENTTGAQSETTGETCTPGYEMCPCVMGVCLTGLSCVDQICLTQTEPNSTTTQQTSTSGDSSTADPSSSSTSNETDTEDSPCHVTCDDIFGWAEFSDPDDYDSDPCLIYGTEALNWPKMVEATILSEAAGALCAPFSKSQHKSKLSLSALAMMTDSQEDTVRCAEFLGIVDQIPENFLEPVCITNALKFMGMVEGVPKYQTRQNMPMKNYPANAVVYQPIAKLGMANFKDLETPYFWIDVFWDLPAPKCRLRMDLISGQVVKSWHTSDVSQNGTLVFDTPNKGVVPRGYVLAELECIIPKEQVGKHFLANFVTQLNKDLPYLPHSMYDPNIVHYVVNP